MTAAKPPRRRSAPPQRSPGAEGIHELWDALADFGASRVDEALLYLLRELSSLADAQKAFWIGTVRLPRHPPDPLNGWRPRAIRYLDPSEPDIRFYKQSTRSINTASQVDESIVANVRQAGTFRANLLRDLVSPEWFTTPFYDAAYRGRQIVDALFVACPVNRDAESFYGFYRQGAHPPFDGSDRDRVAAALRGLKWFHRQVMLSQGLLVAGKALNATEQRVLRLLLTDRSEKEIAGSLGLTHGTTHGYVTALLRKFGVSGRAGLTALWLGQPPSPPSD